MPIIKWLARTALGAVVLLCITVAYCAHVQAAPITVTWTNPTSFDDGSALVPADIAATTVEYSSGTTFGTVAGQQVVAGSVATVTIDRPPGSWCFRAYTTAVTAKGGGRSVVSNVACRAVPFPNPRPPTLLDAILAWIKTTWARWFA